MAKTAFYKDPDRSYYTLGAKTMIRGIGCSTGTALVANDVLIGVPCDYLYDGTNIRVMNSQVR